MNILLPILCFLAGGLMVLAFEPINWSLIGFIAPAVLLFCWLRATPAQAFWRGTLFGLGLFGFGTSWIYISIHTFGNAPPFLAGTITAIFTVYCALFFATQGLVFALIGRRKKDYVKCLLLFPFTWVIWEWLRSLLFTGFPWLILGYSQTSTILNGYAPILSVYGISLIMTLISGAVMLMLLENNFKLKITSAAVIVFAIAIAVPLHYVRWTHVESKPITIAMVQGNVPQSLKWTSSEAVKTIRKYATAVPDWRYDLIIWPEGSIPVLTTNAKSILTQLNEVANLHKTAIIFGIPAASQDLTKFFNAIMVVGKGQGIYYKRHLVPFGEYTPLGSIFGKIMDYFQVPMSNLSPGPKKQPHLTAQNLNIAPFICYEVAYPHMVIPNSRNSQLLITINDDSWFGNSLASSQQLQMAQMRSIETQRYMLYNSNTGITAIINPKGQIVKQAPENQFYVLTGVVYPVVGNTPIMTYGFYPLIILLVIGLILGIVL